jgi:hypothetical protein
MHLDLQNVTINISPRYTRMLQQLQLRLGSLCCLHQTSPSLSRNPTCMHRNPPRTLIAARTPLRKRIRASRNAIECKWWALSVDTLSLALSLPSAVDFRFWSIVCRFCVRWLSLCCCCDWPMIRNRADDMRGMGFVWFDSFGMCMWTCINGHLGWDLKWYKVWFFFLLHDKI